MTPVVSRAAALLKHSQLEQHPGVYLDVSMLSSKATARKHVVGPMAVFGTVGQQKRNALCFVQHSAQKGRNAAVTMFCVYLISASALCQDCLLSGGSLALRVRLELLA